MEEGFHRAEAQRRVDELRAVPSIPESLPDVAAWLGKELYVLDLALRATRETGTTDGSSTAAAAPGSPTPAGTLRRELPDLYARSEGMVTPNEPGLDRRDP